MKNSSLSLCEIAYQKLSQHGKFHVDEFRLFGVSKSILNRLVDIQVIEKFAGGSYQLSDSMKELNSKIALVSEKLPEGIICLTSALALKYITKPDPSLIWVAIQNETLKSRDLNLPIKLVDFSMIPYSEGVETQKIEGVSVKYFSVAKSLADCFRHRDIVGFEIVKECLNKVMFYGLVSPAEIAEQAKIGRVENIMRPYVETWIVNSSI